MSRTIVLGLCGQIGSGKTTVQDYLTSKHSFFSINFADKLKHIALELDLPLTRGNLQKLGHGMRQILYDRIWIDQVDHIIRRSMNGEGEGGHAPRSWNGWVIGDVRYPNEAEWLTREMKGTLIFLSAPMRDRYERITRRGLEKDKQTFDQFIEAHSHPTEQIEGLKAIATHTIENNGTIQGLHSKVDEILISSGILVRY